MIETIASTKAVIASQLNGQVDIGAGSYVGYVAAQAAGARFRILAEASTLLIADHGLPGASRLGG